MTDIQSNTSTLLQNKNHFAAEAIRQQKLESSQASTPQIDPLLLAYFCIYDAVKLENSTATTQAKILASNAVEQNRVINEEDMTKYSSFGLIMQSVDRRVQAEVNILHKMGFSPSASQIASMKHHLEKKLMTPTVLEKIEVKNQLVSASRNVFEDQLTVMRQNAQVGETTLNSSVDNSEQSIQASGSLMNMMVSLTNQITKI